MSLEMMKTEVVETQQPTSNITKPDYEALGAQLVLPDDSPKAEAAPPVPATETTTPPPPPPPPPEKKDEPPAFLNKSFEELAAKRAELRKLEDGLKPFLEAAQVLDTPRLQGITQAMATKNALGALNALGFSYNDVVSQILATAESAPDAKEAPKAAPVAQVPPEVQQELAQLRSTVQSLAPFVQQQQQRAIQDAIRQELSAYSAQYPTLAALEAYDEVYRTAEAMTMRTGRPPGETFAESLHKVAVEVERNLKAQADRFRKVLTPTPAGATVTPEAPGAPVGRETKPAPTLSNNVSAPTPAVPVTKFSKNDVYRALLEDPNF